MWNSLLKTWTPTLTPHTPQAFILVQWPPHNGHETDKYETVLTQLELWSGPLHLSICRSFKLPIKQSGIQQQKKKKKRKKKKQSEWKHFDQKRLKDANWLARYKRWIISFFYINVSSKYETHVWSPP